MSFETENGAEAGRDREEAPVLLEVALVRYNGRQSLAFRDKQQRWRGFFRLEELVGEVELIRTF
jgi:hypothetical protein